MLFGKEPRFSLGEIHYQVYTPKLIKSKIISSGFKIVKFESSYVLISTFYNRSIGKIGEWLGTRIPNFGEHLIVYAIKESK